MWKTGNQPGIKPVIARDTTYGISLLTSTTYGSNFAIPSTKFPPHGNGDGVVHSNAVVEVSNGPRDVTTPIPPPAGRTPESVQHVYDLSV
jgi:hypothetical protein